MDKKEIEKITSIVTDEINKMAVQNRCRKVLIEKVKLKRSPSPKFNKNFESFIPNMDEKLDSIETRMEEEIIEMLAPLQIHASVKTDKKSLPYQEEIVFKKIAESYIPGMFEYEGMFRIIAKELLENDCHKIRFYMFIEPYGEEVTGFRAILGGQGIEYRFRYYVHP